MTKEDKELLWVDLCARLPYGVRIQYDSQACKLVAVNDDYTVLLLGEDGHKPNIEDDLFLNIEKVKPYLRPMSSMTDKERKEINELVESESSFLSTVPTWYVYEENIQKYVDFCLLHRNIYQTKRKQTRFARSTSSIATIMIVVWRWQSGKTNITRSC